MTLKTKPIKMPLHSLDRIRLRKAGIRIAQMGSLEPSYLAHVLGISREHAAELIALAGFQEISGIGPKMAQNLVMLGHYSLESLRGAQGSELFDQLERLSGCWIDSCVEDGLRWIVSYANDPSIQKQWYDFTPERKQYRAQYGHPADRPTRPWYEC